MSSGIRWGRYVQTALIVANGRVASDSKFLPPDEWKYHVDPPAGIIRYTFDSTMMHESKPSGYTYQNFCPHKHVYPNLLFVDEAERELIFR